MSISIGVVSTSLSPLTSHSTYDVLDELLEIATTAMLDARADGEHQTRHAINPALTVLLDENANPNLNDNNVSGP